MVAPTDVTPSATRAASSWQTGVVAGRASFRTAREWSYEPPSRAPLLLRFRDRLEKRPDDEQDDSLYPERGQIVK